MTASSAIVVTKEPVPVPVISHVNVIVWSQVFVQDKLESFVLSASVRIFVVAPSTMLSIEKASHATLVGS